MTLAETFPKHGTAVAVGPTLDEIRSWPATVSVEQASTALGWSTSWSYALIAAGEFPARVICARARRRVVTASLIELLEGSS